MNDTANSGANNGFLGSSNIGGFGYGIGVSLGVLLLITTITLASYFCTRGQQPTNQQQRRSNNRQRRGQNDDGIDHHQSNEIVIDVGLDEATIKSYPRLLYSEAKLQKKDSTAMCCSICLADYKSSDMLRVLPDCNHLFHVKCVDPWLRLHPTCPVCRTSPIPTPLSTPLAEVAPLASRRDWCHCHGIIILTRTAKFLIILISWELNGSLALLWIPILYVTNYNDWYICNTASENFMMKISLEILSLDFQLEDFAYLFMIIDFCTKDNK